MSGHVLRGTGEIFRPQEGQEIPDEAKEVSAVMLKFKNAQTGFILDQQINRQGKVATLAWPIAKVMARGDTRARTDYLDEVAYLVVVVAAGSILASIYNTMNERRRNSPFCALGARRTIVFSAIVMNPPPLRFSARLSATLCKGGSGSRVLSLCVPRQASLDAFKPNPTLWLTPLGMIALGALAPRARLQYRTDVASNLTPLS
jgi:putative ABC transport system permease protein